MRALKLELLRTLLLCFAVLYVFSAAAYLRFHWITEEGLTEGDSVGYYFIAKKWSQGDLTDFWGDSFYRPAVYALDALAILMWGDNDYSIKVLNGIADLVSLTLVLFTSVLLTRSVAPGLIASSMLALSYYAVRMSRSGMPHALTAALVMSSICFIAAASRYKSVLFLTTAAGIALGLAANTHADVALLGPGFVAAIAVQELMRTDPPVRSAVWRILARTGLFGAGCLMPYVAGLLCFGPAKVIEVISAEVTLGTWQAYIEKSPLYRVPYDILAISSLPALGHRLWFPVLTLVGAICSAVVLGRRVTRANSSSYVLLFPIISFLFLFPILIGPFDNTHSRLMIGLFPLLFLMPAVAVFELARAYLSGRLSSPVLDTVAGALILVVSLWLANPRDYFSNPGYFNPSRFRVVHDAIGARVSATDRLLILPSIAYYTRGFNTDYYFGENAEFLGDQERRASMTPEQLVRIIRDGDFSYLYFSDFGDYRFMDAAWGFPGSDRAWWRHMKSEEYFAVDEQLVTNEALIRLRAHLLFRTSRGQIYSLRKRPLFPNSDFESGTLDNWQRTDSAGSFALKETLESAEEQSSLTFTQEQTVDEAAVAGASDAPTQRTDVWAVDSRREQNGGAPGELTSVTFRIEESVIGFRISGSGEPQSVHVALRIETTELRAPPTSDAPASGQWDVARFRGKLATLFIRDLDSLASSGIRVDEFYYVY